MLLLNLLQRLGLISTIPVAPAAPLPRPLPWREGDSYAVTDSGLRYSAQPTDPPPHQY